MRYVVKGTEHEEPTLRLSLEQMEDGSVDLCGEDDSGRVWSLLEIKDGKISTVIGVNPEETGFEVDKNGEIEIYYED